MICVYTLSNNGYFCFPLPVVKHVSSKNINLLLHLKDMTSLELKYKMRMEHQLLWLYKQLCQGLEPKWRANICISNKLKARLITLKRSASITITRMANIEIPI